jgi:hypothetical protein
MSASSKSSNKKVVVAIDFGTTFSGVGWGELVGIHTQKHISRWPTSQTSREGHRAEKVPTKLRYTGSKGYEWGSQISDDAPEAEIVEWFKLYDSLCSVSTLC